MKAYYQGRAVYIVDGTRSAFLKAKGKPGRFSAADLAVAAGRKLFARLPIEPSAVDETIFGCMMPSPDETNIGRLIGYRLGCGKKVPGYTVQRNCASGMQAIDEGVKDGSIKTEIEVPYLARTISNSFLALAQRIVTRGNHLDVELNIESRKILAVQRSLFLKALQA